MPHLGLALQRKVLKERKKMRDELLLKSNSRLADLSIYDKDRNINKKRRSCINVIYSVNGIRRK